MFEFHCARKAEGVAFGLFDWDENGDFIIAGTETKMGCSGKFIVDDGEVVSCCVTRIFFMFYADDNMAYCMGVRCIFRSEEHTSELQSRGDLVCRLLLEKK